MAIERNFTFKKTEPERIDPDRISHTISRAGKDGRPGLPGQHGMHGLPGSDGRNGSSGMSGWDGSDGTSGDNGQPGRNGDAGTPGTEATSATPIHIEISGSAGALKVEGNTGKAIIDLGNDEDLLLITTRGGDGGKGGDGGDGGNGGDGGSGGNGGDGGSGSSTFSAGRDGEDGGDGGNGGHGGHGGGGGNGGRGGSGGTGGNAASISVSTRDPRLFALIETECRQGFGGSAGMGGRPGQPGSAGSGGRSGSGGSGGSGGPSKHRDGRMITSSGSRGSSGFSGSRGRDGSDGKPGNPGIPGQRGLEGKPAEVDWIVLNETGSVVESSHFCYDLEVVRYRVRSENEDEIYEPGETIHIDEITVRNCGGLTLPEGARLFFPEGENLRFSKKSVTLPRIPPGDSFTLSETFSGSLAEIHPQRTGPFEGDATFSPRAELLGRPFAGVERATTLLTKYPVRFSNAAGPSQLGKNVTGKIKIGVSNISSSTYGNADLGELEVRIVADRILEISASDGFSKSEAGEWVREISDLPPNDEHRLSVSVCPGDDADYCVRYGWQAKLYLRGKCIETHESEIRVSPAFVEMKSDLLLVTDETTTRENFLGWEKKADALGLTINFWDRERYGGISATTSVDEGKTTWVPFLTGGVLIVPSGEKNIEGIKTVDLRDHFAGTVENIPQGGVLLLGPIEDQLEALLYDEIPFAKLEGEDFSGRHFSAPTEDNAAQAGIKIRKRFTKENPQLLFRGRYKFDPTKIGGMRWSYGRLSLYPMVLERLDRLFIAKDPILSGEIQQKKTSPVFFSLIASLSISQKLTALLHVAHDGENSTFQRGEESCTLAQIIGCGIAEDIEQEFDAGIESLPRLNHLLDRFEGSEIVRFWHPDVMTTLLFVVHRIRRKTRAYLLWPFGMGAKRRRKVVTFHKKLKSALFGENEDESLFQDTERDPDAISAAAKKLAKSTLQLSDFLPEPGHFFRTTRNE